MKYCFWLLLLGFVQLNAMEERVSLPSLKSNLPFRAADYVRPYRAPDIEGPSHVPLLRVNPHFLLDLSNSSDSAPSSFSDTVAFDVSEETNTGLSSHEKQVIKGKQVPINFNLKKDLPETTQSTEIQRQIKKANIILVRLVEFTNKLHKDALPEEALPLIEQQLALVETFEKEMGTINVAVVRESGLLKKIDAVKELLQDTIAYKKDQLLKQEQEKAQAQELLAAQEALARQQKLKVTTYLSSPQVQTLLNKPLDTYNPLDLPVNLEFLGLRDFSFDEEILRLPLGSLERTQLIKVQRFEMQAFQRLEKKAPDLKTVLQNIREQIGSVDARGVFVKQVEEKIAFLQSKEIMDQFDPVSKAYVEEVIASFLDAIEVFRENYTSFLLDSENVTDSLTNALSSFGTQVASTDYDIQNRLVQSLRQLRDANHELKETLGGICLPLKFAKGTYETQFAELAAITGREAFDVSSNKALVSAINTVLSPEYALAFLDSQIQQEAVLGQNIAKALGRDVLKISGYDDGNGYVVSEIDGQQIKLTFERIVSELGVDSFVFSPLPTSWQYTPHDFLKKVGDAWLRNFEKNNNSLSGSERFKKEQFLCDAWQVSGLNDRRIDIFRQMGAELFSYPMAKTSLLESLTSQNRPKEFTKKQKGNAKRLLIGLSIAEIPSDEQLAKDIQNEDPLKSESVQNFSKALENVAMSLCVKKGPARAGIGFLENMQTTLLNSEAVNKLVEAKQLPLVLKELTAFQQSVLQGKSVDDFSLEWWQIELYQRAEALKGPIDSLHRATSNPSAEVLQQMRNALAKKIKGIATLDDQILRGKYTFSSLKEKLHYQQANGVEGVLYKTLFSDESTAQDMPTPEEMQKVVDFFDHASLYKELLGDYQNESVKRLWQQRLGLVAKQLKEFTSNNAVRNRMLFAQYPDLLENINILIEYEKGNSDNAVLQLLQKERARLLGLKKASDDHFYTTEQLPTLRAALKADTEQFYTQLPTLRAALKADTEQFMKQLAPLDNAGSWKNFTIKWKKQKTFDVGDFGHMAEVIKEINTLLFDAPDLLSRIDVQLAELQKYDPKNPSIALLKKYRKQLKNNQKLYRSYLETWQKILNKNNVYPFDRAPSS